MKAIDGELQMRLAIAEVATEGYRDRNEPAAWWSGVSGGVYRMSAIQSSGDP
jgi:hypothetical protein